jgi:hypothetical protein
MLRRLIGVITLTVAVGVVMALVTVHLSRSNITTIPTADNAHSIVSLWQHGITLLCWAGLAGMMGPWLLANAIIAYRWALALNSAAWRFQAWAAWKVSEARNRAHAAEMWDNHPALTDDERADIERRKLALDLIYDSMLIVGEDGDYIPSDDVLDRAYHAGNVRHHWGGGTRDKALSPIRDYIMIVGPGGGARQTVLKRGNLRVFARELEIGTVKLTPLPYPEESEGG